LTPPAPLSATEVVGNALRGVPRSSDIWPAERHGEGSLVGNALRGVPQVKPHSTALFPGAWPSERHGGRSLQRAAEAAGGVRSFLILVALALLLPGCARRDRVRVASKEFTESIILGDMVSYLAADAGAPVEHARSLGDTSKPWLGVQSGELDVYVEYTGTLTREILADEKITTRR